MTQVLEQDAMAVMQDENDSPGRKRKRARTAPDAVEPAAEPAPPAVDADAAPADLEQATSATNQDAGNAASDESLALKIEALLLATDRPLSEGRIGELTGVVGKGALKRIARVLEQLNSVYEATGRSFRAKRLAGGWQLMTQPEFGDLLAALHEVRQQSKLTPAGIETLAIIAYRQPIMRAEIEAIRGVAAGDVLRGLLERRLIKIVGRAEVLGRPMLYGTTSEFLKVFGLASLDDLPQVGGLATAAQRAADRPVPVVDAPDQPETSEQATAPAEAPSESLAEPPPADA